MAMGFPLSGSKKLKTTDLIITNIFRIKNKILSYDLIIWYRNVWHLQEAPSQVPALGPEIRSENISWLQCASKTSPTAQFITTFTDFILCGLIQNLLTCCVCVKSYAYVRLKNFRRLHCFVISPTRRRLLRSDGTSYFGLSQLWVTANYKYDDCYCCLRRAVRGDPWGDDTFCTRASMKVQMTNMIIFQGTYESS